MLVLRPATRTRATASQSFTVSQLVPSLRHAPTSTIDLRGYLTCPFMHVPSPSKFSFSSLLCLTSLAALHSQDAGSTYAATVTTFIPDMTKNCTWSDLELGLRTHQPSPSLCFSLFLSALSCQFCETYGPPSTAWLWLSLGLGNKDRYCGRCSARNKHRRRYQSPV